MNKTLNINLAGLIFHIDEDAFQRLEKYLETLKRQFSHTEGGNEIISDIETRIAELFKERTSESKEVINLDDVEEVIGIMGEPEDYLETEDPEATSASETAYSGNGKRIFRDPDNRILGGVSSGLAAYFNMDPLWIRLLFVILLFTGPGVLIYIIMWIVIPKASTTAEKLRMRGEPVNISNIQRSIQDEMSGMGDKARHFSQKAAHYDYSRPARGIGGFLNDLGNFLVDAIKLIFKFLFKLIGFFFLFIGFILLFAIVMSLVVGTVDIAGTEYGVQHFFEFMQLVTESGSHYNLLMVAIVLSVIAPLFLMIYFGIRILFDLDPLNRPTKSALGLTTFIGLILLLIAGVRIGIQFSEDAYVEEEVNLPIRQTYHLQALDDSIAQRYSDDYDTRWLNYEHLNAFNMVEVDIDQTDRENPYVEIITKSQGEDRKDARKKAEDLRYEISVTDSVITIPPYYLLGENEKFRAQRLEITLYLPPGHGVYLDGSLVDYIYDVDNVQNMWDYRMGNRLWIMTQYGLSCDGCEMEIEEEIETDSLENDTGQKGKFKMKINGEGIDIDYESKDEDGKVTISAEEFQSSGQGDSLKILNKYYELYI